MAKNFSFDVYSECDLQEVDNAINQTLKELKHRYDFRNVKFEIDFQRAKNAVTLKAEDEFKLNAVMDTLKGKLVKRNVPLKNMDTGKIESGTGMSVRQHIDFQQGISGEAGRKIVKFLKEKKLKKVQTTIQEDQVRISAPSKNDLQTVMALLRGEDFGVELKFGNYR